MKNNKILPLLVLVIFFIGIIPVNAADNDFIVPCTTPETVTADFVYFLPTQNISNDIQNMLSSQEFQNYLQKNGINKDEYELKLVSPSQILLTK